MMRTIAQITDLHITTDRDPVNSRRNEARLRDVLKSINALAPRPSAIIATGDLTDRGEPEEYAVLKAILADTDIPIHLGVGNHDTHQGFRAVFPDTPVTKDGFVQYTVDFAGLRLVMCDTLEEGLAGGSFCPARATWLSRVLAEKPGTPTLLALHHPPIASGISWMDEPPDSEWLVRLAGVLKGQRQIQTLACGHIHRGYHGRFAGQMVSVSPATSIQLAANFSAIDKRVPDGRTLLVEEPPGYTLFGWDEQAFAVHVCVAGSFPTAVPYAAPLSQE